MSKHSADSASSKTRRRLAALAVAPVAVVALTTVMLGLTSADKADGTERPSQLKPRPDTESKTSHKLPRADVTKLGSQYRVAEGDTVKDVANRFGVSTAELLAANGLSWRTMLAVGQQLRIPQETSGTVAPSLASEIRSHRVIAGDTLEAIARFHQVQPRAIMSANGLHKTSRLVVGQRLVIPNAEVMVTLPAVSVAGVSA